MRGDEAVARGEQKPKGDESSQENKINWSQGTEKIARKNSVSVKADGTEKNTKRNRRSSVAPLPREGLPQMASSEQIDVISSTKR